MQLERNLFVSLLGRGLTGVIGIVSVPIYLRYLGVEAYGAVGFYTTFVGIAGLLDAGLSTALSRSLARAQPGTREHDHAVSLAATVVRAFWGMGGVAAVVLVLLSGRISAHWGTSSSLPPEAIRHAFWGMAGVFVLQWPMVAYNAVAQGRHRLDLASAAQGLGSVLRALFAWITLAAVAGTLTAFFAAQAAGAAVATLFARRTARRLLPEARAARASLGALRNERSYLLGVVAMSLSTVGLTQLDKALLSVLVPLEDYSAYMVSATGASALLLLAGPIFGAVFPQLAAAREDHAAEREIYLRAASYAALLVWPAATSGLAFAEPLLALWLQDGALAARTAPAFRVLLLGFALNVSCVVPQALVMARGLTAPVAISNAVASLLAVPSLILLAPSRGPIVAAWWWLAVTAWLALGFAPLLHRLLRVPWTLAWIGRALLRPILVCGVVSAGLASPSMSWVPAAARAPISLALGAALLLAASRELLRRGRPAH